jgi:hypothetical protein
MGFAGSKTMINRMFRSAATSVMLVTIISTAMAQEVATPAPNDGCDRACLKKIADLYFVALAQHKPSLLPLSPDVKYTETGRFLKLGEGIWRRAGAPTYRFDLLDPQSGGIGVNAVVPDGDVPTIMALRLKVRHHLITEVETVLVPKRGPGDFAAPENLVKPPRYFTRDIRPAEQNSRYELIAAADAYFRAFESEGTPNYIRAPLLPDTIRIENGIQTTNAAVGKLPPTTAAEQFDMAAFKGAVVADRRYPVVDTQIGAVMSLVRFGDPNGSGPPPVAGSSSPAAGAAPIYAAFVAETFAITQGKIVQILASFTSPQERLPTPFMPAP